MRQVISMDDNGVPSQNPKRHKLSVLCGDQSFDGEITLGITVARLHQDLLKAWPSDHPDVPAGLIAEVGTLNPEGPDWAEGEGRQREQGILTRSNGQTAQMIPVTTMVMTSAYVLRETDVLVRFYLEAR